ncbi:VOC family protein [Paenibacillus doosanensis]|uniref:Lactoylglutathione lyase n=1 Tax=Paenibacillus konkukensis TaxID=2020716 RepID=A0ABY4RZ48_9BACL|nr:MULTISPECIES: VOC family protein [Paenibacillus]MCS7458572.1 VOC family protein [Paenibacillus doosanensis]UQZ86906.1 Lactoylglutathione lyase [Paenibacillus konkukensis]
MIKRIGHLALTVKDMEQSLHFYCNVLGFAKAFELHDAADKPWIVYLKVCEGQFIELFYGGLNKPAPVDKPIGFNHLCLEVEDIHAVAEHLKKNGIALDVEPKMGKDTNYQCWAKDPDGNRIEFMQLMPGSPQLNS